jgi:hypothetical protein
MVPALWSLSMPRAVHPATPDDDIEARRNWHGATVAGDVLTAELVTFCQSGVSMALSSVTPQRRPVAAQGLGCRISAEGVVRLAVWRPAALPVLDAVMSGAGLAATLTKPYSHRSIQLKAQSARIDHATDRDVEAARTQSRIFADELVDVGYPPSFAATYIAFDPDELVVLEFVPTSAFVQTPGPRAGAALTP